MVNPVRDNNCFAIGNDGIKPPFTNTHLYRRQKSADFSNGVKLSAYKKRRDFKKTCEPRDEEAIISLARPIYLVQKHDARNLHYDLRLEIDGVLKSWAVPKMPSTDPLVKRLAVQTEDHPLAYAAFEGMIPEGEYGAGKVEIWDRGTFENIKKEKSLNSQYRAGQLEVDLKGRRLKGAYVLIKTGPGKNWLLKKMRAEE